MKSGKIPTETAILAAIRSGQAVLPPLQIELESPKKSGHSKQGIDAFLRIRWGNRSYHFAAGIERLWTPKALSTLKAKTLHFARQAELNPIVIVPYLSESNLQDFLQEGVSGFDLCGNGAVTIPGELLVFKSGQANRFKWETEIKNIFRGTSSIIPRLFLLKPHFPSVQGALHEIQQRGSNLTLGTVSKVCKSLEDLLILERRRSKGTAARELSLIQPEKLLELLTDDYEPPTQGGILTGKTKLPPEALHDLLGKGKARVTLTGLASTSSYAIMAKEPIRYYYTTDIQETRQILGSAIDETDRFPNIHFCETREEAIYFDVRPGLVASPVQTYLELATGDKRSRETADQVRRAILLPLEQREA